MVQSILSNARECYVCKNTNNLHVHHIYYGTGKRKLSDKYGCWVYLCAYHHNMSNKGVHFDKKLNDRIKRKCQAKWEEIYGNRKEFRKVFGKSYL